MKSKWHHREAVVYAKNIDTQQALARPLAATKSEARNPKSETNSNDQKRQIQNRICERKFLIIRKL